MTVHGPVPAVPLGIADLMAGVNPARVGAWFWCRRHEQAHRVGARCNSGSLNQTYFPTTDTCIDVGPFMSEREADRLESDGFPTYGQTPALGMEITR